VNAADRIRRIFADSIAALDAAADAVAGSTAAAAQMMAGALDAGNKILACGNGGSAADAVHFSAELLNRFERERRPLPAVALCADFAAVTAIANDYDYGEVFAKQVRALGAAGDVVLCITTSGNSASVNRAAEVALRMNLGCIALSGRDGGALGALLAGKKNQVEIRAPGNSTARIQEVHGVVIHCLCDFIERSLAE